MLARWIIRTAALPLLLVSCLLWWISRVHPIDGTLNLPGGAVAAEIDNNTFAIATGLEQLQPGPDESPMAFLGFEYSGVFPFSFYLRIPFWFPTLFLSLTALTLWFAVRPNPLRPRRRPSNSPISPRL